MVLNSLGSRGSAGSHPLGSSVTSPLGGLAWFLLGPATSKSPLQKTDLCEKPGNGLEAASGVGKGHFFRPKEQLLKTTQLKTNLVRNVNKIIGKYLVLFIVGEDQKVR